MLNGHLVIGELVIYGRNAMHWGVNFHTKKYGFICFRLPFRCYKKWWPLYLYFSPNATPWASTFMLGRKHDPRDYALSRIRKYLFGHNFNVDDNYTELRKINDSI
jgi:hypothetical protein